MSWLWGAATNPQYEELVEKACSSLNLPYPQSEDMALNLEITDMIRSKAVQPKPAMQSLKRRVASPNGRVQMYALGLVDTCIKNGGDHFLAEIASKEFVDEMTIVIKSHMTNAEVKQMALKMFQAWALAFEKKRELAYLTDVYHDLKNSGTKFPPPPIHNASSLIETTTAPNWVDSDVCMRCRTAFTFTNRKHHCRNCGLVFDQACSSHVMPLPKFGIKEEVRICDGCWLKGGKDKPAPAVPGRTRRTRQDYDSDLQRAIELSLQQSQPGDLRPSEPPLALKTGALDDEDEQMRLAIEASLRDMERAQPSAPYAEPDIKPLPTFDLSARETETILTFSNTLDQMAAYGERDLRRFPQAHILHDQALAIGGKLQRNAEEKGTKQMMLTEMQNKLAEAVSLYGSILDGQQAYAQRKAQEAQHQQYGYYQPQQYAQQPQPYANGYYVPPQAAPPQHQAPSMYPSMPSAPQSYAPQQQQYQAYQQPQQPWQSTSRQASANYAPTQSAPMASPPLQSPQKQHMSFSAEPQGYTAPEPQLPQQHQYQPSAQFQQPQDTGATQVPQQYQQQQQPQYQQQQQQPSQPMSVPSAPPHVDLASHPSLSPKSVVAPLSPSRAGSYTAPSAPMRSPSYTSAPLSPAAEHAPSIAQQTQPSAPTQQQHQAQHQAQQQQQPQPNHQPVNAPSAPNPWNNNPNTEQGAWYTASMFPSAPPEFPNAPQEAPARQKSPVREEALLIEL